MKETLLGPTRKWNNPMTLRSKSVKNATDSNKSKQWINQLIKIIRVKSLRYLFICNKLF